MSTENENDNWEIGDVDGNGDTIVAMDNTHNCIIRTKRGGYYFCNPGIPGEYLRGKAKQAFEVARRFKMEIGSELENVL